MILRKPSRTARKKDELKTRLKRRTHEDTNKKAARRRDRGCRFPLCGCKKLKLPLRLEVAHSKHKGMGGNPAGDRSVTELMVQLCDHRHQHGIVSLHKGTLRADYLTAAGFNGAVSWLVDVETLGPGAFACVDAEMRWVEVARESRPGVLEALTGTQQRLLKLLAEMDL